jgi:hypothetical protein
MKTSIIFLFSILYLFSGNVFANNSSIRGIVFDANTGDILSNAVVCVTGTPFKVNTDNEGKYEMDNLPIGSYDIEVLKDGYDKRKFRNIFLEEDKGLTLNIGLFSEVILQQNINQVNLLNSQATIRGKIVDKNNNPVAFTKVFIEELNLFTFTDEQGRYAFRNFDQGVYTLSVKNKKIPNIKMPKRYVINISVE